MSKEIVIVSLEFGMSGENMFDLFSNLTKRGFNYSKQIDTELYVTREELSKEDIDSLEKAEDWMDRELYLAQSEFYIEIVNCEEDIDHLLSIEV